MNREEKKTLTHRRILDAAVELFELQGYEMTTVQQIADRAEVAKGTFFNYFASKEDLIMELQGFMILQEFDNVIGQPGPILPRLQTVLSDYARQYPLSQAGTRAILQGVFGSARIRGTQTDRCLDMEARLALVLEIAQARGEIRCNLPARTIAQLVVQTYYGAFMSWSIGQGVTDLAEQIALTFDIFIQGLQPE